MHMCLCIHTVRLYKHAFFLSPSIHIHTFTGFRNANSRDHCLIPSCLWRQLVEIVREMQWSVKLSSETDGEREREWEGGRAGEKCTHCFIYSYCTNAQPQLWQHVWRRNMYDTEHGWQLTPVWWSVLRKRKAFVFVVCLFVRFHSVSFSKRLSPTLTIHLALMHTDKAH